MAAVVDFPSSRGILWDRTAISNACYIKAGDVIPPLFLSSVSVLSLLKELSSTDITIERRAMCEHLSMLGLTEGSSHIPIKSIIGSHTSVLKIDGNFFEDQKQNNMTSESCLTIPISPRPMSDFGLSFERDSTM